MIATNPTQITIGGKPPAPTPGDIAKAMTGRPYLTHSEVSSFQACSLRWHFQYVEHAEPESTSAAMLLGTCVHAAIQQHLETVMAADDAPGIDQLMTGYREAWQAESKGRPIQFSRTDTAASLEATARQMVEGFLDTPFSKPTGQIVGIEETLRINLALDLPDLVGRVDLIEHREGELVVTDFKTAKSMWSPQTADDHAQQLILYGLAAGPIAEELDAKLRLRFVVLTKAKTPRIEERMVASNPERVERTTQIMRRVFGAMQAGHVYPSPSPMNCSGCAFQRRCATWHRTLVEDSL
jgi:putative RecB family exonuclease